MASLILVISFCPLCSLILSGTFTATFFQPASAEILALFANSCFYFSMFSCLREAVYCYFFSMKSSSCFRPCYFLFNFSSYSRFYDNALMYSFLSELSLNLGLFLLDFSDEFVVDFSSTATQLLNIVHGGIASRF